MNVSGINNYSLSIYCSVEEHDGARREELLEQLNRLGVVPEFHGDKIEFRFRGGRNTVLKLASYAEAHKVRTVSISSGVK